MVLQLWGIKFLLTDGCMYSCSFVLHALLVWLLFQKDTCKVVKGHPIRGR